MGPVLLTRPLADSRRIAEQLDAEGIDSLIWPLTRIVPLEATLPRPLSAEAVVVTSAHGIRGFAALTERRDLPVFCVGARTAEVSRGLGFGLAFAAEGDSTDLVRLVRQSGIRRLIYPRGREISADLVGALAGSGQKLAEVVVYAAEPAGPPAAPVAAALAAGTVPVVTAWSARNASELARWLEKKASDSLPIPLEDATLVAISPRACAPLEESGFGLISIAKTPDAAGMLDAIRQALGHVGGS